MKRLLNEPTKEIFHGSSTIVANHHYDIICVGPTHWDDLWRRRQQIMSRLARYHRVLYLDPLYSPLTRFKTNRDLWQRHGPKRGLRHLNDNLNVLSLFAPIPFGRIGWVERFNRSIVNSSVARTITKLGFQNPILWLYHTPLAEQFIGMFNECFVVYDCFDDYTAYPGVSPEEAERIVDQERRLLSHADIVFTSSSHLYQKCRSMNAQTHWVPNGVDYTLYEQGMQQAVLIPDDLKAAKRPIIGLTGQIKGKIDMELIDNLARLRPQWSFVFVGPVVKSIIPIANKLQEKYENVLFLGEKDPSDLPRYVAAFDIAIIPFIQNDWTRSINPLKLYEYLACGKPVVSTAIPDVVSFSERYPEAVQVAVDYDDFLQQLEFFLERDCTALREKRLNIARANSWDARVEEMLRLIAKRMEQPNTHH